MTSISRKLVLGGLAAGLIAMSGATSAFAMPQARTLPKTHQIQTLDNQALALYPAMPSHSVNPQYPIDPNPYVSNGPLAEGRPNGS
jgi:hypothetical protein